MHYGAEVTESSTNKQHHLSKSLRRLRGALYFEYSCSYVGRESERRGGLRRVFRQEFEVLGGLRLLGVACADTWEVPTWAGSGVYEEVIVSLV